MRDPQSVGENYLELRAAGVSVGTAASMPAKSYEDGGHISSDPAEHHSKTPQTQGSLDDGGST
jgi:hypothetical protein